jgi:hypothetical protein
MAHRSRLPVPRPSLLAEQRARGVTTGVAASVLKSQWKAAEIYPLASNPLFRLREREIGLLRIFGSSDGQALVGQADNAGCNAQAPGLSAQPLLNHDQPANDRIPPDAAGPGQDQPLTALVQVRVVCALCGRCWVRTNVG